VSGDQAVLDWQLPAPVRSTVTVERSTDGVQWSTVNDRLSSGTACSFTDADIQPGRTYAWRVRVLNGGTLMASAPTWLSVPVTGVAPTATATAFGLRRAATISRGSLSVLCSIPQQAPGRVELLDVGGRLRDARDMSALGSGVHRVDLGRGLEAGIYFARFTSGTRSAAIKGIVLH
jgi:hypothetical protein